MRHVGALSISAFLTHLLLDGMLSVLWQERHVLSVKCPPRQTRSDWISQAG